jgi:KTSC domain-containing protein
MARGKHRKVSERTFSSPEKARAYARRMAGKGGRVEGSAEGLRLLGIRPPPAEPAPPPVSDLGADEAADVLRDRLEDEAEFPETYDPTNTAFPDRPRSSRAHYDANAQILNIEWARPGKKGPSTNYYDVTPQQWEIIKNTNSTGQYVDLVLNDHHYDYP